MGGPKGVIRPGLNLIPRSKSDEGVNGAKTKREKAAADSDSDSDDAADDFLRSNAMAVEAGGDADKVEKKTKKKEKDARGDAPEVVAADGADGKVKGKKKPKANTPAADEPADTAPSA